MELQEKHLVSQWQLGPRVGGLLWRRHSGRPHRAQGHVHGLLEGRECAGLLQLGKQARAWVWRMFLLIA